MHFQTAFLVAASLITTMVSAQVVVGQSSNSNCDPYDHDGNGAPEVGQCYQWEGNPPDYVFVSGLADDDTNAVHFYSGSSCDDNDQMQLSVMGDSEGCLPVSGMGIIRYKLVNE
jgi:hypothetical protein